MAQEDKMTNHGSGRAGRIVHRHSSLVARRRAVGVLLVTPAVVLVSVLFLVPLIMTVNMSMHHWPLLGHPASVGWSNYASIIENSYFLNSLLFTLKFAVTVIPGALVLGLALAVFFARRPLGHRFAQTAVFIPVSLGFAAAGYLWLSLLSPRVGILNYVLVDMGIVHQPVNWLINALLAFVVVALVTIWKVTGFGMVAFKNRLDAIPREIEEAAALDGAGRSRTFFSIKLPMLRQTIALIVTFLSAGTFLTFDQFYAMTGGGPQQETVTLVYRIYDTAFTQGSLGLAASMSIVLLLILLVFTGSELYLLRQKHEL